MRTAKSLSQAGQRMECRHYALAGADYSSACERLLTLAGTAESAQPAGCESGSRTHQIRRDRSLEAIQRQVTALDVPRFEIETRDTKFGQTMDREWSRAEIEQSAAWLKCMNAKGSDVYIRLEGEHGLILVDDIKPIMLEKMRRDGFTLAATIETSPGNYQAWVKLSDMLLTAQVRRIAAQELANDYQGWYQGGPNSVDSYHNESRNPPMTVA